MDKEKPMTILLIEDDENEVNNIKNYIETRKEAKLVKFTNSSYEGIELVKKYMPEGVILDLELHNGEGSGLNFLEELKKVELDFKPLIVVTTNVYSEIVYSHIRTLGADFILYKKQKDYSPEIILNTMIPLRSTIIKSKNIETTETPMEYEERIKEKINIELDLVGIPNHLKGRKYLFEAILYLIQNENEEEDSAFRYLINKYKLAESTPGRAMQTAINNAWKRTPIDELLVHYKNRINYKTGVPNPTEFTYYYRDKIKKLI